MGYEQVVGMIRKGLFANLALEATEKVAYKKC
jgi:hypothetical protein